MRTLLVCSLLAWHVALADDTAAKAKYQELVEKVEKTDVNQCMLSGSQELFQQQRDALQAFFSTLEFLDFTPDKPVKLGVPDDFYNPQGQAVVIKSFEIFVSRSRPDKPYIVVTRIPGGLRFKSRFTLHMGDKVICVGDATTYKHYGVDGHDTRTLQQLDEQHTFADWQGDQDFIRSSRRVFHQTVSQLIDLGSVKTEKEYLPILSGYVTGFNALNAAHPYDAAQRADICTALEQILDVLAMPNYRKCADLPFERSW